MLREPVIVDIDDVIMELRSLLSSSLSEVSGKNVHYTEWNSNKLHEVYGIPQHKVVETWIEHEILERAVPEEDAVEAMTLLREAGYPTVLVTKRGWHPNANAVTFTSLRRFKIPFDFLKVVDFQESKLDAYKHMYPSFTAIIDDQSGNLDEALASTQVRQTHLVCRPWNKDDNTHNRSSSLLDAVSKIIYSGV